MSKKTKADRIVELEDEVASLIRHAEDLEATNRGLRDKLKRLGDGDTVEIPLTIKFSIKRKLERDSAPNHVMNVLVEEVGKILSDAIDEDGEDGEDGECMFNNYVIERKLT